MAPAILTPVKGFTGTVAGVAFANGVGETENPAALAYFRRKGYIVEAEESPATPESPPAAQAPEQPSVPAPSVPAAPTADTAPERPHPVRDNKAVWFEYLTKVKPDHGFDLEKSKREELIAAVNDIEGASA